MTAKDTFGWQNVGTKRPANAIEPKPGQESVWDYPRPPALIEEPRVVKVESNGHQIAFSLKALKLKETASPPTFYLPREDVDMTQLVSLTMGSHCEWKGQARYFALSTQPDVAIGWTYEKPKAEYIKLAGYLCFYPSKVDCWLDEEKVRAQKSEFYGGWVTDDVVGPFKGEPGTGHW